MANMDEIDGRTPLLVSPVVPDRLGRPFGLPCFANHQFSILSDMRWIVGGLILAVVGFLLRRLLWTRKPEQRLPAGLPPLGSERRAVYDGFAPE